MNFIKRWLVKRYFAQQRRANVLRQVLNLKGVKPFFIFT